MSNILTKTQQAVNIINEILKLDYNKVQLVNEENIQVNIDEHHSLLLSDVYIADVYKKETEFVDLCFLYKEKFINRYCISKHSGYEDIEPLLKSVELLFINVRLYLYNYNMSNLIEMRSEYEV